MVERKDEREREGELCMMTYLCSAKETFDEIALRLYGDEKYAGVLLEANPLLAHKIMMDGGETMRAPEIAKDTTLATLPPWKRGA